MATLTTTFDPSSPESGWEPFLDWLRSHDIDPHTAKSVTIHDDTHGTAQLVRLDENGNRIIADGEPSTYEHQFEVHTPPPRRIVTQPERT